MAWQLRREGSVWQLRQDGTTVDESEAKDWADALNDLAHHCLGSQVVVSVPHLGTIDVVIAERSAVRSFVTPRDWVERTILQRRQTGMYGLIGGVLSDGPLGNPLAKWIVGISIITGAVAAIWKGWLGPMYRGARDNIVDLFDHIRRSSRAIEAVERDLIPEDQPRIVDKIDGLTQRLDAHMIDEARSYRAMSRKIASIERTNKARDKKVDGIAQDVATINQDVAAIKVKLGFEEGTA